MLAKILGITKYVKKETGVVNYTLHFCQEFSEYEKSNGAEGLKVSTVWTQLPDAAKVWVNDLVDLRFEPGFEGRATLTEIVRFLDNKDCILNTVNAPGINDPTEQPKPETATTAKGGK